MAIIADLSEWQGKIDFTQLKGKVDGVILRVQHGYTHPDSRYEEYVAGCRQNDIPFGTYAYFAGVSVNDAIAEAKNAIALTDKDSKCFAVDIEELSMNDLVSGGQAFIDTLKAAGIQNVGIYSYKGFYDAHNLAAIKADWHWIAGYGVNDGQPHTDPGIPNEDLWQFTSVGHLQGIQGNVDESQVTGDFPFFGDHMVVKPVGQIPAQFCTKTAVLQTLRCDGPTDIRVAPDHKAQYVRDAQKGEVFHVFDKVKDNQGHVWDNLGGANWVDETSGVFYWLDNPNLPKVYTVQSGDTLSSIAAKFGDTVDKLVNKNGLTNPNRIYPGQKLYV